ncbi:hypothetical protein [Cryptosporangium phraense]|uniref:hypothetical protein n=1 Tax=Cryptosporangium phraense TaxID=2593070 RepID=UPI00197ACB82|nr:hypothetical protein [Cryptosporangium phraense]
MPPARRIGAAVLAAVATGAAQRAVSRSFPAALARTNHRGESVTLAEGPAVALGATVAAVTGSALAGAPRTAVAAAVAGLGAAAVGAYDDVVGARPEQKRDKGFAGHLRALQEGRVSAGAVKVAGVGLSAVAAGLALAAGPRPGGRSLAVDAALSATVIAGAANVVNLFDLRPGRALKVGLLVAGPLAAGRDGSAAIASAVTGAAAAALPDDLGERSMLGDAGANALGALLGVGLAARLGRPGRALVAAGLIGLMAASERVSFTAVIARTPALNALDMLGRRPAHTLAAEAPAAGSPAAEVTAAPNAAEPIAAEPNAGEPGPGAGGR